MDFPLLQRGIEGDLKTRFGQECKKNTNDNDALKRTSLAGRLAEIMKSPVERNYISGEGGKSREGRCRDP
jgi:hypothetical protein